MPLDFSLLLLLRLRGLSKGLGKRRLRLARQHNGVRRPQICMVLLVLDKGTKLLCIQGLIPSTNFDGLRLTPIGGGNKQIGVSLLKRCDRALLDFEFEFLFDTRFSFLVLNLVRDEVEV